MRGTNCGLKAAADESSSTESGVCAKTWRQRLLAYSDLPLRTALAATFLVHGYQKIFVVGVDHFAGMLQKLNVPLPGTMAWVAALAEFGGAIGMILGLLTRLSAFGHAMVMVVAIGSVHFGSQFTMTKTGEGWEWQFALLCIAVAMLIRGAGPLSVDHLLRRQCGFCERWL